MPVFTAEIFSVSSRLMKPAHGSNVALLLAAMILASGCSSSQMSRIDRNRDLYEAWPLEIKQAVLDGKVEAGMTPDMVRVAWGEPSEIVSQSANGDEIWVFKKGGSEGSVYYPGGGGAQYPGMARSLYRQEPAFRATVDEGLSFLPADVAKEVRALWLEDATPDAAQRFHNPALQLPAKQVEDSVALLLRGLGLNRNLHLELSARTCAERLQERHGLEVLMDAL